MLGSRIEELLASEMEANGGFAVITDEAKQRQLLLDDEEEDFMDEGNLWDNFLDNFLEQAHNCYISFKSWYTNALQGRNYIVHGLLAQTRL